MALKTGVDVDLGGGSVSVGERIAVAAVVPVGDTAFGREVALVQAPIARTIISNQVSLERKAR